jgi:hypothetical protein
VHSYGNILVLHSIVLTACGVRPLPCFLCVVPCQVGEGVLFQGSTHRVDRADLADLIAAAVQDESQYSGKTLYIST